MTHKWIWGVGALLCTLTPIDAMARPGGPDIFCQTYSDSQLCQKELVGCQTCHLMGADFTQRNPYGVQVREALGAAQGNPGAFNAALPEALAAIAALDADGDGASNLDEIMAGTDPAVADQQMMDGGECDEGLTQPGLNVCAYDPVYVFKKINLDFCGIAPTYDELEAFKAAPTTEGLVTTLKACLNTEFWRGKDGVVWNMANNKIKPLQAIKTGQDRGSIPLGDYEYDYNLFVWAHTGDRSARDVLLAKYYVERDDPFGSTIYTPTMDVGLNQKVEPDARAGLITHRWFFVINTMFTSLPRTTAAQAYRAYLGYDIARNEGLQYTVNEELVDYDAKGVTEDGCLACHNVLDPLSYPFSRYHGIDGGSQSYSYNPNRPQRFRTSVEGPLVRDMPEAGYVLGQRVDNLRQWAEVAAASRDFSEATVRDYWTLLVGQPPSRTDQEFMDVVDTFEQEDARIEAMLEALVLTEAYGVP